MTTINQAAYSHHIAALHRNGVNNRAEYKHTQPDDANSCEEMYHTKLLTSLILPSAQRIAASSLV